MNHLRSGHEGGPGKKVILLNPRGFCAGVVRAIDIVRIALETFGPPIYVRKEIVHNRFVVDELRTAGAVFVDEVTDVPEGARLIYSAHGVSPAVREEARKRKLRVIDATCPLVTKVHLEAVRFAKNGYTIVLIGHREHDEVIGTLGEAPESTVVVSNEEDVRRLQVPDPNRIAYLTQTTLSLDETAGIIAELRRRFPAVEGPPASDICYATQNRQEAVKEVAPECDLLLVVGSHNSSNSRRLVEVAKNAGAASYLIDDASEIRDQWLQNCRVIGVTAGASAPEHLVEEVLTALAERGFTQTEVRTVREEDVHFALPPELMRDSKVVTISGS